MGFRFWRRIKLLPGVNLNLSKGGASVSLGRRGARLTVGSSGARATAGIPGTGLFYTEKLGGRSPKGRSGSRSGTSSGGEPGVEERLTPGFVERLFLDDDDEALLTGCKQLFLGDVEKAVETLSALDDPDACFIEALLQIKAGEYDRAIERLEEASRAGASLGETLSQRGVQLDVRLPITEEISAVVRPGERGLLLARVEALQLAGRSAEAEPLLQRLLELEPGDVVVRLSLAELLLERPDGGETAARRAIEHSEGVENDSPVGGALLLYRARALNRLGLHEAARTTCTATLRRRKGREPDLLHALRYERALAYEALGNSRRARSDLEHIYSGDGDFMDVAKRLGVAS